VDKVVHFEIHFDKPERAEKFYSHIFGWKMTKMPSPSGDYYLVNAGAGDEHGNPTVPGAINGGMQKRGSSKETTVIVINVPSIDKYLPKIKKAGGKVVMPKVQVMDMGFYARVTDTEGNVIGIWEDIKR